MRWRQPVRSLAGCSPSGGGVVASWRFPAAPRIEEDEAMNFHVHALQRAAGAT